MQPWCRCDLPVSFCALCCCCDGQRGRGQTGGGWGDARCAGRQVRPERCDLDPQENGGGERTVAAAAGCSRSPGKDRAGGQGGRDNDEIDGIGGRRRTRSLSSTCFFFSSTGGDTRTGCTRRRGREQDVVVAVVLVVVSPPAPPPACTSRTAPQAAAPSGSGARGTGGNLNPCHSTMSAGSKALCCHFFPVKSLRLVVARARSGVGRYPFLRRRGQQRDRISRGGSQRGCRRCMKQKSVNTLVWQRTPFAASMTQRLSAELRLFSADRCLWRGIAGLIQQAVGCCDTSRKQR